jgi:class 3 adenylate cyclase
MAATETRFAMNGDLAVAYRVFGETGPDVLLIPNWLTNIEANTDVPEIKRWFDGMASFSRCITFDQPGSGVSDPISLEAPPSLEQWVDSARVVIDAVESERTAILAMAGAFPTAAMFASTNPARTSALVSFDGAARTRWAEDYPFGIPPEVIEDILEGFAGLWGTGDLQHSLNWDMPWNEEIRKTWARQERQASSPRVARQMIRILTDLDVRDVLPSIRCPTLVVHHTDDPIFSIEHARYLVDHIPEARLLAVPGRNYYPLYDDWRRILDEVREFITGTRDEPVDDERMLSTVLFTDIVESTKRASQLGDRDWRALLDAHDTMVRAQLARFRGREVKTVGDGFLATFDGPQRAIRCGVAIRDAVQTLGVKIRAGLHTGECEVRGDDIGGIALHIASRVVAEAGPSEVLVSSTVKDLVVGSGLAFEDRGPYSLKGVPGEWRLFSVLA